MYRFLLTISLLSFLVLPSIAFDTSADKKPPLYSMNGANYRSSEGAIKHFFEKILRVEYCVDGDFDQAPCKPFYFKDRTLEQSVKLIEVIFQVTIDQIKHDDKIFYMIKKQIKSNK